MNITLTSTRLFRGIDTAQLQPLLQCLGAVRKRYARGETILAAGAPTEQLGMVLSGMAMIGHDDIWGNHSLLGHVTPGEVFAEPYACIPGEPLRISVTAAEDTEVLFLNVGKCSRRVRTPARFTHCSFRICWLCAQRKTCCSRSASCTPRRRASGPGSCRTFPRACSAPGDTALTSPITGSSWLTISASIAAPCAASCHGCSVRAC